MQKLIPVLILIAITVTAQAQKISGKKVPQVVKDAFKAHYPKVTTVKWEKEKGNYEAGFILSGVPASVLYEPNGTQLQAEIAIPDNEMPQKVKEYVSKKYPGSRITETSKIMDNKGNVTYEAEVKGKDLIFDSNGNFLR